MVWWHAIGATRRTITHFGGPGTDLLGTTGGDNYQYGGYGADFLGETWGDPSQNYEDFRTQDSGDDTYEGAGLGSRFVQMEQHIGIRRSRCWAGYGGILRRGRSTESGIRRRLSPGLTPSWEMTVLTCWMARRAKNTVHPLGRGTVRRAFRAGGHAALPHPSSSYLSRRPDRRRERARPARRGQSGPSEGATPPRPV
jgi:hypothetical protein